MAPDITQQETAGRDRAVEDVISESSLGQALSQQVLMPDMKPSEGTIEPSPELGDLISEARSLLVYLTENGEPPREEVTTALFEAEMAVQSRTWTAALGSRFLKAFGELAKTAKPVTSRSLFESQGEPASAHLNKWSRYVRLLLPILIVCSALAYANGRFATDADELINYSSKLEDPSFVPQTIQSTPSATAAATSVTPAVTPPERPGQLQTAASPERRLDAMMATTARMYFDGNILSILTARAARFWGEEVDVKMPDKAISIVDQLDEMVTSMRLMRIYLAAVLTTNRTIYGVLSTYILPLLCALLGACAYGLRSLSEQTAAKTFRASNTEYARATLAVIAGFAVGLFSDFTAKLSLQPLAAAFVAGYAVETFFIFLDSLLQAVQKTRAR